MHEHPLSLKEEALYAWKDIAPFVSVSRETWRLRTLAGTAPQPIHLGKRSTRYRGSDVLAWLASPTTYRADIDAEQ